MRIGIAPFLNRFSGGMYQYTITMLRALYESTSDAGEEEFVIFTHRTNHSAIAFINSPAWTVKTIDTLSLDQKTKAKLLAAIREGQLRERLDRLRTHPHGMVDLPDPELVQHRPDMKRRFQRSGVKLMLYPAPIPLSFEAGIPYVMAIHDLQHRLQPEFPEVSANGKWEWREYLFRNGARYATLLLTDSEVGKEDVLNFYGAYGVTSDRVKVLPFLPACYPSVDISESEKQRVRTSYHLPERYLFYPAQFWPHKNHARIIQALGLLKQQYRLKVPIVLVGSHLTEIRERTFNEVISLSHRLRVANQVHYLGYVPDENMASLYSHALALVMPTFFGPTNIPVLEAWAFGCPVLTSDIRGIREQVGDAAILVNPRSVEAIADGIYRIWTDDKLHRTLADRGRQRLATYTHEDYSRRLTDILEEAKARACSEKTNRFNQ